MIKYIVSGIFKIFPHIFFAKLFPIIVLNNRIHNLLLCKYCIDAYGNYLSKHLGLLYSSFARMIKHGNLDTFHSYVTKGAILKQIPIDLQAGLLFLDEVIQNAERKPNYIPMFRNESECSTFCTLLSRIKLIDIAIDICLASGFGSGKIIQKHLSTQLDLSINLSSNEKEYYQKAYANHLYHLCLKAHFSGLDFFSKEQLATIYIYCHYDDLFIKIISDDEKLLSGSAFFTNYRKILTFSKDRKSRSEVAIGKKIEYIDLTNDKNQITKFNDILKMKSDEANLQKHYIFIVNEYIRTPFPIANCIYEVVDSRFKNVKH